MKHARCIILIFHVGWSLSIDIAFIAVLWWSGCKVSGMLAYWKITWGVPSRHLKALPVQPAWQMIPLHNNRTFSDLQVYICHSQTILIEKTERSDTTNIQYSIVNIQFGSGLAGLGFVCFEQITIIWEMWFEALKYLFSQ